VPPVSDSGTAAGRRLNWDRRHTFLLSLTGTAGALDALSFVHLGKVFTSFQSGNVLFLGLGIGNADGGLAVRAGTVIAGFFLGTAAGARLVGRRLAPGAARTELDVVAIEAALLTAFAALWIAVGTPDQHHVLRVALLALAALAMGIQAALVLALKIPNVVTVALTATLAYLGQRAGAGSEPRTRDGEELPSSGLLVALLLTYVACALVVAVLPETAALSLVPLVLLVGGVTLDQLRWRTRASSTSAARSSRSRAAR
jgi:uncharacterized membrane protein YoaK (UPF0700 family)